jgi:putative transposase
MQAIHELKYKYDIVELVKIADVSRSVYYYYVKGLDKVDKYADIKKEILSIYAKECGKWL